MSLEIVLAEELVERLRKHGLKHYPNEFGGLLIGRYVDNNKLLRIEETLLPKDYQSSRYIFQRGVKGLREELTKYFAQSPSLSYVGEWHTHPDAAPAPSATDLNAMHEIVNHNEVFIENPVLLIIGLNKNDFRLGFYVYVNGKLYPYEKKIELDYTAVAH